MKTLFICLICIGLSSCIRVSDLNKNQAFLHPEPLNSSIGEALSQPYFKRGAWPELHWWEKFNSLELNQLMMEALLENPSILSVKQKVEAAIQSAKKMKAPLFPRVGFNGFQEWGRVSSNGLTYAFNPSLGTLYDTINLDVAFEYTFDFWGKYRNQLKSAIGEARSQRAEAKQVELIVSTTLAKVYFALKTNLVRRSLYQELYKVRKEALDLNELLYLRAIHSKIQPASAVESLEEVAKEIYALNEEIQANIYLINVLRGKSPDFPIELSDSLKPVPAQLELPDQLNSDLMIRRPDLIASIWRIESLAYEVNVAIADFFPQINLLGFIGLDSLGFKHLFDWKSRMAKLSPSIHIPIFKAGEIKANYRKNKAQLESAIFDYNELLLKSLKEVAENLDQVTKSYKQMEAQKVILKQALLKLELLQLKYERGIDSLLGVYQMQEEKIGRELQAILITYQQYAAIIETIKSLGGGYTTEDLEWFQKGGSYE